MFFIGVGLIMGNIGAPARPLADVFVSLDLVITKLVGVIMWYAFLVKLKAESSRRMVIKQFN